MFAYADDGADDPLDDPLDDPADGAFDYQARCDELRRCETGWLRRRRRELVREQRRLRIEEYAVTLVLAERDALDDLAGDGVSERTSRDTVDTAKSLEHQPHLAGAAHRGDLSDEQLTPLSKLADESDEAEWARRGPNISPSELRRRERTRRTPTPEDGAARRASRDFGMWWRNDMLHLRGALPDLDGKEFETVMLGLIDRMKPAKGQPWDTFGHRGADALMELVHSHLDGEPANDAVSHPCASVESAAPRLGSLSCVLSGAEDTRRRTFARAGRDPARRATPSLRGVQGLGRREGMSAAVVSSAQRRCTRPPTCTTGLDTHHLVPRSWGGTDDISNLLTLCKGGGTRHHQQNIPQGQWALIGNPNLPDGLRRVHRTHPDAPKPPKPPKPPDARAGPAP